VHDRVTGGRWSYRGPMEGHVAPEAVAFVVFGFLVLGFALVSRGLDRVLVTAPLAFVALGSVIGFAIGPIGGEQVLGIKVIAEITLVLILFHDAATVRPRDVRSDKGAISRLLLIGFPLTVLLGWAFALWVFPQFSAMFALLLAASLAPTDAGLGAPTVLNPVVPVRVRRLLNVESGLNDGLATPLVLFAIAAVAGSEGLMADAPLIDALVELFLGVVVGALLGILGGLLIGKSRARGLSSLDGRQLAVLMIPLLSYGCAVIVSGNGYVAAFISGMAFAGAAKWYADEHSALELTEQLANPLGYAVWLVFGIAAVPLVWNTVGWREVVFALLALTVMRMVPTAIALFGTRLRLQTVVFVGWFGPRGLASIVFALIALETLEEDASLEILLATISLTVVLSVVAHGVSAAPLAERYGAWVQRERPTEEMKEAVEPRSRDSRLRVSGRPAS
jgi:NhaP-type Na+/H+ or K+/H+ antiporter